MKKMVMLIFMVLLFSSLVSARFYGVGQTKENTPDFEKEKETTVLEKTIDLFSDITGSIVKGNCEENTECNDNNECTINDLCLLGECVGEPLCNDGDIFTKDYCKNKICKFVETKDAGCIRNSDCNDGSECTEDICYEKGCFYYETNGCIDGCRSDKDCNDNNHETIDTCRNKRCENIPKTIFRDNCFNDSQCSDGIPCSISTCEHESCRYNYENCKKNITTFSERKEKVKNSIERFSKIEVPFFVIIIFIVIVIFVLAYGKTITVIKKKEESSKIKSSKEIDKMMKKLETRLKKL